MSSSQLVKGSGARAAVEAAAAVPPRPEAWLEAEREQIEEREEMVRSQIEARGINDPRVLEALRIVPRHRFVPEHLQHSAYTDSPLPIPGEQTISQPYIVAFMTEAARITPSDRCL